MSRAREVAQLGCWRIMVKDGLDGILHLDGGVATLTEATWRQVDGPGEIHDKFLKALRRHAGSDLSHTVTLDRAMLKASKQLAAHVERFKARRRRARYAPVAEGARVADLAMARQRRRRPA